VIILAGRGSCCSGEPFRRTKVLHRTEPLLYSGLPAATIAFRCADLTRAPRSRVGIRLLQPIQPHLGTLRSILPKNSSISRACSSLRCSASTAFSRSASKVLISTHSFAIGDHREISCGIATPGAGIGWAEPLTADLAARIVFCRSSPRVLSQCGLGRLPVGQRPDYGNRNEQSRRKRLGYLRGY
jgi:hypothetical protein